MIASLVWTFTSRNGETECTPPFARIARCSWIGTRTGMHSMEVIVMTSPGEEVAHKAGHIGGDGFEETLTLLRRRKVRMPHYAAVGDLVEFVYRIDGLGVLHVRFPIRRRMLRAVPPCQLH